MYAPTPTFLASNKGYQQVSNLLKNDSTVVESLKEDGPTPLLIACENGHAKVVELLLNTEQGKASINTVGTRTGTTPLIVAAGKGFREIVQMLIEHKADIEKPNKFGQNALFYAIGLGQEDTVKLLSDNGAKWSSMKSDPLYYTRTLGFDDLTQKILGKRYSVSKWRRLLQNKGEGDFVNKYNKIMFNQSIQFM